MSKHLIRTIVLIACPMAVLLARTEFTAAWPSWLRILFGLVMAALYVVSQWLGEVASRERGHFAGHVKGYDKGLAYGILRTVLVPEICCGTRKQHDPPSNATGCQSQRAYWHGYYDGVGVPIPDPHDKG